MALSESGKIWQSRSRGRRDDLAASLQLPAAIVALLQQRGLEERDQIIAFLSPALDQLPDPGLMKGMAEAVSLLRKAITAGEPVTIFGDYDVDGITSTALLLEFLLLANADVSSHIPNRLTDGYGLNSQAIEKIFTANHSRYGRAGLLLTVDCGISAVPEVDLAKQRGFTVIITDHHRPPEQLPDADAILNPLQPGCQFPDKHLAGVGVVFYLLIGLRRHLAEQGIWSPPEAPNLKSWLDLVALGTIADQAPLLGLNRILVKGGEEALARSLRPGLAALKQEVNLNGSRLSAEDIAFRIAPRLNAAGRLGDPQPALALLLATDPAEARELAVLLDETNRQRKQLENQVILEAEEQACLKVNRGMTSLVLHGRDWHPGVLGIVASRILEKFNRPTILLTEAGENLLKGSGRSAHDLNIFALLSTCSQYLLRYGGHDKAAGLSIKNSMLSSFVDCFEQRVREQSRPEMLQARLEIDWQGTVKDFCDPRFLEYYARLMPFGNSNQEPIFTCIDGQFEKLRIVGNNHLQFALRDNGHCLNGIGFGFGDYHAGIEQGKYIPAFAIRQNEYKGERRWQLHLIDLMRNTTY